MLIAQVIQKVQAVREKLQSSHCIAKQKENTGNDNPDRASIIFFIAKANDA